MTQEEKKTHLEFIFENFLGRLLQCPHCGYPYRDGYVCLNCRADNVEDQNDYPLEELLDF